MGCRHILQFRRKYFNLRSGDFAIPNESRQQPLRVGNRIRDTLLPGCFPCSLLEERDQRTEFETLADIGYHRFRSYRESFPILPPRPCGRNFGSPPGELPTFLRRLASYLGEGAFRCRSIGALAAQDTRASGASSADFAVRFRRG